MKKYNFRIKANEKNAIGKPCTYVREVEASNFKEANLMLYNWYDHIMIQSVNGQRYDPYNEPE